MLQLAANILYSSATIFLVGISFSIIYSTAKFFHFAHAAIIAIGAYAFFIFCNLFSFSTFVSVILGIVVGTGIGWCLEWLIYRPMRKKGASPLIQLLASLGLYILLQNGISLFIGDDTKVIGGHTIANPFDLFGAKFTTIQIIVISLAILAFCTKVLLLDKIRAGLALRAVESNPELAEISGVDLHKTMTIAFCLGSFLASTAGICRAFDVGMTPTMGLPLLLLGVVAVIVGGNGKAGGIAIASVLLASFQQNRRMETRNALGGNGCIRIITGIFAMAT